MTNTVQRTVGTLWPDYRTVWRWHFYAGLFCIPFVVLLALSGSMYLFKPQVEAWIDHAYDQIVLTGYPASAAAQIKAALAAVPGSTLHAYELPQASTAAVRVLVKQGEEEIRVYVHPETLQVLKIVREAERFMSIVFRLHGELLLGNWGSALVELAASWAIIMIITGWYLWWPRQAQGLGGVVYPRLGRGVRVFWRDLHAVTGIWISSLTLFLLVSGLPWAKVWGDFFEGVRQLTGTAVAQQDWTHGQPAVRAVASTGLSGEHGQHRAASGGQHSGVETPHDYTAIDTLVMTVRPLALAPPVLIAPPTPASAHWTARSEAQNRPRRVNLVLDGATGVILQRENFTDRHPIDQLVGIGIAAHEGQLFGWPNQLLNVVTAGGLILVSVSAVLLWWRRRAPGMLGAPPALQHPRFALGLCMVVVLLGISLPLFGASLLVVKLMEKFVLSRMPAIRDWLGLSIPV
jgi:uncharacterized iron-regulated membrane protein